MKTARRMICVFLIAVLVLGSPAQAFAAEEERAGAEFPAADREMIDNTTDSSRLPAYPELSDVYGQISSEDADVVDTMLSEDAREECIPPAPLLRTSQATGRWTR